MRKLLFFAILSGAILFSCKKNDSGSGQPLISGVRLVDSTKRDSTFTKAVPGTLIVIQGSNLGGLQAVYFNDTSAFFNPVYATNSNIIITIPSTAQTMATDPKVPSVIKVVTNHGTASYSFQLFLPPPVINSITFDNSGTLIYINGSNFEGIQKITFPVPGNDTALSYTVNKTFTQITAAIPPGTPFTDSLRVYCTFGSGAFSYPPPMVITSVSNENGTGGTTITVDGTNFVGIDQVIFPGNIPGTNLLVTSVNQLSVTVPSGITTTDSLRLNGVLGTAASPQLFDSYITYPSPGYLCTFENQWAADNTGFLGWTGGYADAATASTTYPNGTGAVGVLDQASPMGKAQSGTGFFGWNNPYALQLNDVPWVSNTSQSINNYALKFEIYTKVPWTAGAIWISVGDWSSAWTTYAARYAPWSLPDANGKFNSNGWMTVTIPLTSFITGNQYWQSFWTTTGNPANNFTDYINTGLAFLIGNDDPNTAIPANTMQLAIDNVRVVKYK